MPRTSQATTAVSAAPLALRIHVPTLIGEVGLNTRSMFRNRSGRPRSLTSSSGLTFTAAAATSEEVRARERLPAIRAASDRLADAPARPPVNRYQPTSDFQTGCFRIGRP